MNKNISVAWNMVKKRSTCQRKVTKTKSNASLTTSFLAQELLNELFVRALTGAELVLAGAELVLAGAERVNSLAKLVLAGAELVHCKAKIIMIITNKKLLIKIDNHKNDGKMAHFPPPNPTRQGRSADMSSE